MPLRRDDWLDVARKVDWTYRYIDEREVFPESISGTPWLPQQAWKDWNETYRTTYREYVRNQRAKDDELMGHGKEAVVTAYVSRGFFSALETA
jgi:toluene monooxygenase system protein A